MTPRWLQEKAAQSCCVRLVLAMMLLSACALTSGCQSIHTAARRGDTATVRSRLKCGTDPNERKLFTRTTPLIEAAIGGHLDVVRLLVDNGADVNIQGESWQAPLHFAAAEGHVEIVRFLLAHGADVSLFKPHTTPLHAAASRGQVEVARILLYHGAGVNWKGDDEATPLEVAASNEQPEMVKLLLDNGADVNSRGLYGRTPLHIAAMKGNVEIGRMLLEHGADPALKYNGRPVTSQSPSFRRLLEEHARTP